MQYLYTADEIEKTIDLHKQAYTELLRHPALSAGMYLLKAGDPDLQRPHSEDEVYYVLDGVARMTVASEDFPVRRGDLIYVPAYTEHRFYDITRDLKVLVFFSSAHIEH
ncbi:MAG: cupin domain-containing protein [Saprospiraceae bacterium]|nr:cupin domain-containing protein [Saprospiraceae bacterium]